MASSNPFRKSLSQSENRFPPIDSIDTAQTLSGKPNFHNDDDESLPAPNHARRKKSLKKVRVLSPPPRSPESPEWPGHAPPPSELFAATYPQDPFSTAVSDDNVWVNKTTPPPHQPALPQTQIQWPSADARNPAQSPVNPFSKTPQDGVNLKQERRDEGEALKAANTASRRSLNVDSFRRLLMTGAASPPNSPPPSDSSSEQYEAEAQAIPYDSRMGVPGSNVSRPESHSGNPDKTGAIRETPATAQPAREKKPPPPPPSSRHGKSLKADGKELGLGITVNNDNLSASLGLAESSRPPISRGSTSDSSDTSFSRDLIIKALDPELNIPVTPDQEKPNPLASAPNSNKKPVPAPPPRRGHARAESRALNTNRSTRSTSNPQDSDPPSRTSMDSNPSRPSSIRHGVTAPVPPPPRRPNIGPRQLSITPLASISSSNATLHTEPDHYTTVPESPITRESPTAQTKPLVKPPPPPTRQPSTRRAPSIHSIDTSSRRVSADGKTRDTMAPPPPPPPARHRGSSQSSLNGPPTITGIDGIPKSVPSLDGPTSLRDSKPVPTSPAADFGKSNDILADLDALQREVDALRGKMS
ncbi:hypothetical protein PT974_03928 [Cladobotryum mycophilum]|uniref:Uncharacterized protein n=1 Tax=Cladobotryum mycophilum TaxID=491253 RepID=A0ABR0STR7_9HYPO